MLEYGEDILLERAKRTQAENIDASDIDDEEIGSPFRVFRKKCEEFARADAINSMIHNGRVWKILGETASQGLRGPGRSGSDGGSITNEHDCGVWFLNGAVKRDSCSAEASSSETV